METTKDTIQGSKKGVIVSGSDESASANSSVTLHSDPSHVQKRRVDMEAADVDDDQPVHDQLPTVAEAKATIPHMDASIKRTSIYSKIGLGLAVVLIVSVIAVVTTRAFRYSDVTKAQSTYNIEDNDLDEVDKVGFFLYSNGISTLADLSDETAPQNKASAFVAQGGAYHLELTQENAVRIVERYIVTLLYYAFNGQDWTYQLKFLEDRDHCDWWETLESESGKDTRLGVRCNSDGYIVELNLSWNELKGTGIPSEISFLTSLETLMLYNNNIGGSFPDAFQTMSSLRGVEMMRAGLTGALPQWLGGMTQLTMLALGNNDLTGQLPQSISNLTNLELLGLDDNDFSGNLALFRGMSKLEALYLEDNRFTGTLGGNDATLWPHLQEFDASDNMLVGSVPSSLLQHPTLIVLDLNSNDFTGELPSDILQNTVLQYLALHTNSFNGTMSDHFGLLQALKHLDISFNQITGTIPPSLLALTHLNSMALSGNEFTPGPLVNISTLTNLRDLSLKNTNLKGSIPEWIGQLNKLELLDLDANSLTGSIPSSIGQLQGLQYLLLNRNELTGTIPSEFGELTALSIVLLDSNALTGNADAICENDSVHLSFFIADCYPSTAWNVGEIECQCCTTCCSDEYPDCNDKKWTSTVDPVWEYGFIRPGYRFNIQDAPSSYSKGGEHQDENVGSPGLLP